MSNTLTSYLEETGLTVSALAARMGIAPSSLTRPLKGQRDASMQLARDIEAATGGRVTASDFLTLCLSAQKREDSSASDEAA